uniref:Uncharacterized protein LOC104220944 n=1 Tax=Nicotiana sylvestris TaxID=4096 RepID=A0A1U7W7I3_NICSY|nr:PREDICTED: uncharacterized protein LOC104220944 [Nicotiana sylvestris]
MVEDCELWDIICDGPYVPTKVLEELPFSMEKTSKEYTEAEKKAVEKNFRAKKILEFSKIHHEKTAKMNLVPVKDFKRNESVVNMIRHALATWEDSSSEFEDEPDTDDISMMALEDDDEDNGYKEVEEDKNVVTVFVVSADGALHEITS